MPTMESFQSIKNTDFGLGRGLRQDGSGEKCITLEITLRLGDPTPAQWWDLGLNPLKV